VALFFEFTVALYKLLDLINLNWEIIKELDNIDK